MTSTLKPTPDAAMLTGSLLAVAGYVLPWFKVSPSFDWSFSGWEYATLSSGGGWTLWTFGWLAMALLASLWAKSSGTAATVGLVGGLGTAVFSLALVAASFSSLPERESINHLAEVPMGVGLPLLAIGLGLLVAGGCRSIAADVLRRHQGEHARPVSE